MNLYDTPEMVLALFSAYTFLLICFVIFVTVSFIKNKRWVNATLAILAFVILFLIYQVLHVASKEETGSFFYSFGRLSFYIYLAIVLSLTLLITYLGIYFIIWNHNHIIYSSIINAFDAFLIGVLYFDENDTILLVNNTMADIFSYLDIKEKFNSASFKEFVNNKIITLKNGETYHFSISQITIERKKHYFSKIKYVAPIYEVIAKNVTEINNKINILKEDNERIITNNKLLVAYHEQMPEIIRHQEILKAKINIHEEMNELLISTVYLLDNDDQELRKDILNKWKNNALLLSKENENSVNQDMINDLITLSKSLGIQIDFHHLDDIKELEIRKLFIMVGKETLLNVAKHTKDKKLIIDVIKKENHYVMTFANKEGSTNKNIIYGSGLTNIEKHVTQLNGKMTIINDDNFIVKLEV